MTSTEKRIRAIHSLLIEAHDAHQHRRWKREAEVLTKLKPLMTKQIEAEIKMERAS